VYSMVFRGIPKNFPMDVKLRKLAQLIRYVFAGVIILFVALIVVGYLAFR
jgi:hypothetical protein